MFNVNCMHQGSESNAISILCSLYVCTVHVEELTIKLDLTWYLQYILSNANECVFGCNKVLYIYIYIYYIYNITEVLKYHWKFWGWFLNVFKRSFINAFIWLNKLNKRSVSVGSVSSCHFRLYDDEIRSLCGALLSDSLCKQKSHWIL